ncbi:MAG: AmmeMemoRadiSam system protein A [Peptococcaceae bacterium]|nr:AmmeMemoRadiSam system protein A [Peptococcaceae bacterium]
MSLVYIGFAPHPPIVIPPIGRGEEKACSITAQGLEKLSEALCATGAEILVCVSPHAPHIRQDPSSGLSLTYLEGIHDTLEGDLGAFNAPQIKYSLKTVPEILEALHRLGAQSVQAPLDHGVMVPLYFLQRAGWQGRLVVLSSPEETPEVWGKKIAQILDTIPARCAILASGDLSHRLKEDGPYGFHPSGPQFDRLIVQGLRTDPSLLPNLPEILVEEAAQCGYMPLLLALGARTGSCQVFSYEGPFGVGYMTAELYRSSPVARYARTCLQHFIEGKPSTVPNDPLLATQKSCFVTLHKDEDLRGCIGTLEPVRETLADEIRSNTLSAATRDPRFPPVQKEELSLITISVDVLGEMEKITDSTELDPYLYGVVVRSQGRTGLLLPRLSGVDSVDEQLAIARQKAGILPGEDIELWRFQVDRYYE